MTDLAALSHPTFASQVLVISVCSGFGALICTTAHTLLSIELVPWWAVSIVGAIVGGSAGVWIEWIEVRVIRHRSRCLGLYRHNEPRVSGRESD